MIRLTIAGPLGGDAEVRHFEGGRAAISFSIAHTEKWKSAQGEQKERTTWVRCTLWRKSDQIAIAQYLTKGCKVIAEGDPSARSWTNNQGEAQASLELNVKNVELMGGSTKPAPAPMQQPWEKNPGTPAPLAPPVQQTPTQPIFTGSADADDLPF